VPQQRHVLDRVRAGDHPRDQSRDLQLRVHAAGSADVDVPGDQLAQPGAISELQDRRQARARHEIRIIEDGCEAVAHSHLPGALLVW